MQEYKDARHGRPQSICRNKKTRARSTICFQGQKPNLNPKPYLNFEHFEVALCKGVLEVFCKVGREFKGSCAVWKTLLRLSGLMKGREERRVMCDVNKIVRTFKTSKELGGSQSTRAMNA